MKNKIAILTIMLLLAACGTYAQKRIKSIDITVDLPKAGDPTYDRCKVTAIRTDLFGEQRDFEEGKSFTWGVNMLEFNDYGERQSIHEDEFEAGRKYILQVFVTNYTDSYFNYKNDKNFTADNTTVKATINGKPAKIFLSSTRSLLTDFTFTIPGERNPWYTSTTPSPADGEMNGCGYVDLELPSGNLWATCNVGASSPEGKGSFFAWGETKPKKTFTDKNFIGYGAYTDTNPYNIQSFAEEDNMYSVEGGPIAGRRLKFEYDAARQNMGGEWRIPTQNMYLELDEWCEKKFVKVNGIPGTLWISRINGKSIFTPYCGRQNGTEMILPGEQGFYWSSNGKRVYSMQVKIWGSQYNPPSKEFKNDIRVGSILGTQERAAIECPEYGMPVRGVWANGSKTSKSERTKKAKELKKNNRETEYGDGDDETGGNDSSSSENAKEKKEKKKSKGSFKKLLNKGKSFLNILK